MDSNRFQQSQIKPIPLSQRRSAFTMGLIWLTMVTSYPAVLAGFEWYRQGITLTQLILFGSISVILLLLYSVPACELGARTGLGYGALGRIVFGRWGANLLIVNLIWLFIAWYGLTAVLMAQAIKNLFHCHFSLIWLSVICALLMSFNNLFGFKGVANFARFMSGPVLIIWVGYVFFKALTSATPTAHIGPPPPSNMYALSLTSSFIIGFAVWGNEQDYWRYSRPGIWKSLIPLTVAILIGQIIFPIAGWLIARITGNAGSANASVLMSNYCFGSIAIIGLLIVTADYFSTNDSSLFGCAAAVENIWPIKHNISVGIFAIAGALVAAFLSLTNMMQSLSSLVSLNCILLPTPTIIMITEWWLRKNIFRSHADFLPITDPNKLPAVHLSAIIAFISGLFIGILTSDLFPALQFFHFGIAALNAWLTSIIVYVPLRMNEYRRLSSS